MTTRTKPDFDKYAANILEYAHPLLIAREIALHLHRVYEQGYAAGRVDAKDDWWQEYDKFVCEHDHKEEDK